jgi:CheY-like chemotaxis protein/two-component sensor histidine kinase
MDRQLKHLTRLVDDLLDVSRIDRGKLEIRRDFLAIEQVIQSAVETAKPNVDAKSHELSVQLPGTPVFVDGDFVRLTQVVSNLINNAAKFTPEHGQIKISVSVESDEVVITVADSGVGIPADQLSHIFDMFVQFDSTQAVSSGGLGLGLTLARAIAKMHGGELEAFSPGLGWGSRFVVRLPVASSRPGAPHPQKLPQLDPAKNRILVVDDNQDAATTLGELLRFAGHDVRIAFDGLDAYRQAVEFAPSIAFIDLNMPGMNGIELARKMREDPRTRSTRLIALTGMGQQKDVTRTSEAGFIAHLTKPASAEAVMELCHSIS